MTVPPTRVRPSLSFAPVLRAGITRLRIPQKRDTDDSFSYESPRSPDMNEDESQFTSRRPMANLVPNTIRKDAKNPLTNLGFTSKPSPARTTSLDHSTIHLAHENEELTQQLFTLEDKVRKLRRVRVLYVERDRQVKELQARLSRLLQEIEEMREANPEVEVGLEELLKDLDDDDHHHPTYDAKLVHVAAFHSEHRPYTSWTDPIPSVTRQMEDIKSRFLSLASNIS